jgi:uncharacterized protein with PIN domain
MTGRIVAKFLADGMLGKLARWMRALGLDCAFCNGAADDELVRRAQSEDRVLLTRDRRLAERRLLRNRVVLVAQDDWRDQLAEVRQAFDFSAEIRPLSRCLECNTLLESAAASEVAPLVPAYVAKTQRQFRRCAGCGRIYWAGTHQGRIQATLDRLRLHGLELPGDPRGEKGGGA